MILAELICVDMMTMFVRLTTRDFDPGGLYDRLSEVLLRPIGCLITVEILTCCMIWA